ncbi:MAG: hypothetical protein C0401_05895 [Anaerolinea sp.]|nr:hypothetical protein [Anaerolinea sp.]
MDNFHSDDALKYFDHPSDVWESKIMKKKIAKEWAEWIMTAKHWSSFITLTFRDETYPDVAKRLFQFLVRKLNKELFGKHYMNVVGPSYFSYILGIEYQRRGVIHFHVLVDRPVHYELIHKIWLTWAGIAHIKPILHFQNAVEYVSKYASKAGEIEPFFAKNLYSPAQLPLWWKEAMMISSKTEEETTDQLNVLP